MPRAAILVLTQLPDRGSAQALARALIEARLAACVSVGATVESLYHWRGEIEMAQEVPVIDQDLRRCLRRGRRRDPRRASVRTSRDHRVPVTHGLPPYLDWIDRETRPLREAGPPDRRGVRSLGARTGGRQPVALVGFDRIAARPRAGAGPARARARIQLQRARARPRDRRGAFAIANGYYLYRDKLKFGLEPARWRRRRCCPREDQGGPVLRQGRNLSRATGGPPGARGAAPRDPRSTVTAESQGCADAGVCYPPQLQKISVALPAAGAGPGALVEAVPPKKTWFK